VCNNSSSRRSTSRLPCSGQGTLGRYLPTQINDPDTQSDGIRHDIRIHERDLREANLGKPHLKPDEGGAPHAWSSSSIISTWITALSYFGRVFADIGRPTFISVLASDSKLILPSRTAETTCDLGREESLVDENIVDVMGSGGSGGVQVWYEWVQEVI